MSESKNMIYFKNDILSDIKKFENNMNSKITEINNILKSNEEEYNLKFTKISNAISELIEIVSNRKYDNEKIEELLQMKNLIWAHINENKNKLLTITKDMENAIFRYDRIIIDNLELPGIVGNKCKYTTMRDFFEYVYHEIKADRIFREEQTLGNQKYKERIENLINSLSLRSNEIYRVSNDICSDKLKNFEIMINTKFETTEVQLDKLRVENGKYATELKSKVDKINIAWEKLEKLKNDMNAVINEELKKFKKVVENNNLMFNEHKNEFELIKEKFTNLSEFIRDVRFKKNIGNNRRSSVFSVEARNIDFRKKQILKNINNKNKNNDSKENNSLSLLKSENSASESNSNSLKVKKEDISKENSFIIKYFNNDKINNCNNKTNSKNNKNNDKIKMKENNEINFEINGGDAKNKKKKKFKKKEIFITKEIELKYIAENNHTLSSSSISDNNEIFLKNERVDNKSKQLTFRNIITDANIDQKENKNNNCNEEFSSNAKIKPTLNLQSVELIAIENDKHKKNAKILNEKKNNENELNSNSKFIRSNKNYKTERFINVKKNDYLYPKFSNINVNLFSNKKIINSNKKVKKLLLTDINTSNYNDSDNFQNNEENIDKYKTSRHSSLARKLSFFEKEKEHQIISNKKIKMLDKLSIKTNENINFLFTRVNSLESRYLILTNKINDIFNAIKNLKNRISDNKIAISKLLKKQEENLNNNTPKDFKLFLNKTLKGRANTLSVKLRHSKNKNQDNNFNTSNKIRLPNDEANIILRKIEPYLIKEFTKKNY